MYMENFYLAIPLAPLLGAIIAGLFGKPPGIYLDDFTPDLLQSCKDPAHRRITRKTRNDVTWQHLPGIVNNFPAKL